MSANSTFDTTQAYLQRFCLGVSGVFFRFLANGIGMPNRRLILHPSRMNNFDLLVVDIEERPRVQRYDGVTRTQI